jgi:16S rRNA (guanine966-N2)-methyltransferase
MRITGGRARGRKIKVKSATETSPLRPTASKVREALFNIIGTNIVGASFLDLYAGTGAVGFEALSRGAEGVVFVEINPIRCRVIKELAKSLGYKDKIKIYKMDVFKYLLGTKKRGEAFDFIFIDPPYQSEEIMKILPLLSDGLILSRDGIIIVEHFSKIALPEEIGNLKTKKTYKYGDTSLTTYEFVEGEVER